MCVACAHSLARGLGAYRVVLSLERSSWEERAAASPKCSVLKSGTVTHVHNPSIRAVGGRMTSSLKSSLATEQADEPRVYETMSQKTEKNLEPSAGRPQSHSAPPGF